MEEEIHGDATAHRRARVPDRPESPRRRRGRARGPDRRAPPDGAAPDSTPRRLRPPGTRPGGRSAAFAAQASLESRPCCRRGHTWATDGLARCGWADCTKHQRTLRCSRGLGCNDHSDARAEAPFARHSGNSCFCRTTEGVVQIVEATSATSKQRVGRLSPRTGGQFHPDPQQVGTASPHPFFITPGQGLQRRTIFPVTFIWVLLCRG